MKRLLLFLLVLSYLLLPTSCHQRIPITVPESAIEITVAPKGAESFTFQYTDSEKINAILDYFNNLVATGPATDIDSLASFWSYNVTVTTLEGDTFSYEVGGSAYFMQQVGGAYDGTWYSISYKQANEFSNLLQAMEPDVPSERSFFAENVA